MAAASASRSPQGSGRRAGPEAHPWWPAAGVPPSPVPGPSRASAFRFRFVAALAGMYLLVVLVVTLWPTPVDRSLDPYIERLLDELHQRGIPTFVDYRFAEFSANVVFFVPVGFLGGLLAPRRLWWLAIVAGGCLSAGLELTQALVLPSRVPSLADVLANSAGAVIGAVTAFAVRQLIAHRDVLVIGDVLAGRRASNGLTVRD